MALDRGEDPIGHAAAESYIQMAHRLREKRDKIQAEALAAIRAHKPNLAQDKAREARELEKAAKLAVRAANAELHDPPPFLDQPPKDYSGERG